MYYCINRVCTSPSSSRLQGVQPGRVHGQLELLSGSREIQELQGRVQKLLQQPDRGIVDLLDLLDLAKRLWLVVGMLFFKNFSSNYFLLYFWKLSAHDGLEIRTDSSHHAHFEKNKIRIQILVLSTD